MLLRRLMMAARQALTLLFLTVCFSPSMSKPDKPNVLVIVTDDHGYRDVGYHGSVFDTPVLDELAADGVKLENYYVQPMCSPTRSQLLTGRYQIRTGLQHLALNEWAPSSLPTDEVTLAQKMKESGYSTHMLGKWHLGFYQEECLPSKRGFDSYLGLLVHGGNHFNHTTPTPVHFDFFKDLEPAKDYKGVYSTNAFTHGAIDIINNKDEDTPLFMYLAYQAPHAPLQVPDEYKYPLSMLFSDQDRLTYAAMVSCVDEGIGQVVDALKAKGIYDDTVIIFSTDNGGSIKQSGNNWPLRGQKTTLYEGGTRAIGFVHSPLLPNKVRGTVNKELIHVSDWFPTIIKGIAGGSIDGTKPLDGVNQWKTIKYGFPSARSELLHNIDPLAVVPGGREWVTEMSPFDVTINAAIRVGDWKLLTGDNGQEGWYAPPDTEIESIPAPDKTEQITWLFNIKDDPLEMNDLSYQYPDVLLEMLTKLQVYYLESVPVNYPAKQVKRADPCLNGNNCIWGPWTPA